MPDLYLDKEDLKKLLDIPSGAVAGSGAHPALQCYHFGVRKSKITVTASDQAITVVTHMDGDFGDSFDFLVLASKLNAIVRQSSPGLLQLSIQDNALVVMSGMSSWTIKLPSFTYPKVDRTVKTEVVADGDKFRTAVKATRKCMAESAMRPSLRMLSVRKGSITSCDGSRLAQASLGDEFPRDFEASIPLAAVPLVWDLVKDEEITKVGIADTPNYCMFSVGNTQVLAKKLTSSFPNVEDIMLRPVLENKQEFFADRVDLIKAIERVRVNADISTAAMGLSLSAKSVTVTARDVDGNTSADTLPSSWLGKDRLLIVNHKHLTDLLRAVPAEEAHFFLGEDTKSRKSALLLKDEENQINAMLPQYSGNLRVL